MLVRLAGDTTLTVLVPNASEEERQRLPGAGARVRLGWAPQHMHVIPAADDAATIEPDAPAGSGEATALATPA
jgi:hypothetical protein